ncbi:MAG: serine--tRNA ligase [candidate division Zixibacteria bacterium CG_4_9_14_3_um_filter_46_8]|nr:MAG: serine--tRNA ligase [candidate division Zixibacteria bacterium CG_4_9_14_3_um_filter_46_8]
MLDLKFIRQNPDLVKEAVKNKQESADIDNLLEMDSRWRSYLTEADALKQERNATGKLIADLKKKGEDASEVLSGMKAVSDRISALDQELRAIESDINNDLLTIPNIPHHDVPVGTRDEDNKLIRKWGEKPQFDYKPRTHWELAEILDIIDLPRGSAISGSGFPVLKGAGALLQRSLINFMLDFHITKHGYKELRVPYLVTRETMTGTGQLPKLEADMYMTTDDLFLIPTAEVPVTNLHKKEILAGSELPLNYVAYTPCFRREAGSYGKDTRGIIRIHQFDKVELVKICRPECSYDELEVLLSQAEAIAQALELHYRVRMLCTADLSFASAMTYDIEIYCAGVDSYLEVSSCSNFEDFQARRANIRFKATPDSKPSFPHTLNGSGLALPRLVIAIMENYQLRDGRIKVPGVLKDYMHGMEYINPLK